MSDSIAWWVPELAGGERDGIDAVLEMNYLNDGEVTATFEKALAEKLDVRFAVGVTSGTSAIAVALMAAGIGPGDEVLVPDITFIATANAVRLAGATPVIVDVDRDTLNMSPEAAERAVTNRTRAVVPVHVSGRAADMEGLLDLAQRKQLKVVEDAAEAFGSWHRGRALGVWGDAGCFSFSPNKTITTGQGGAIVTNDEKIYRQARAMKDQGRFEPGTGGDDSHPVLGFNFKLTNLQAAVGIAQLRDLDRRLDRMRAIHSIYRERLARVEEVRIPGFDLAGGEVPQWTDLVTPHRNRLIRHLSDNRVACRPFWHPLHKQPPHAADPANYPISADLDGTLMWLPSSFRLRDKDVHRVCDLVEECFSRAGGRAGSAVGP